VKHEYKEKSEQHLEGLANVRLFVKYARDRYDRKIER